MHGCSTAIGRGAGQLAGLCLQVTGPAGSARSQPQTLTPEMGCAFDPRRRRHLSHPTPPPSLTRQPPVSQEALPEVPFWPELLMALARDLTGMLLDRFAFARTSGRGVLAARRSSRAAQGWA